MIFFDTGDDQADQSKEWRLLSEKNKSSISLFRNNIKVTDIEVGKKVNELIDEFGNNAMDVPQEKLIFRSQGRSKSN
jgi:hypothetical protein